MMINKEVAENRGKKRVNVDRNGSGIYKLSQKVNFRHQQGPLSEMGQNEVTYV